MKRRDWFASHLQFSLNKYEQNHHSDVIVLVSPSRIFSCVESHINLIKAYSRCSLLTFFIIQSIRRRKLEAKAQRKNLFDPTEQKKKYSVAAGPVNNSKNLFSCIPTDFHTEVLHSWLINHYITQLPSRNLIFSYFNSNIKLITKATQE